MSQQSKQRNHALFSISNIYPIVQKDVCAKHMQASGATPWRYIM